MKLCFFLGFLFLFLLSSSSSIAMDKKQFQEFMNNFQTTIKALTNSMKNKSKQKDDSFSSSSGPSGSSNNNPKIIIKILSYKGEPNKNIIIQLRQVRNIFHAQELTDEGKIIHYVATGLEDAALHQFINKIKESKVTSTTLFPN